jgi:hypothetical protein
MAFYPSLITEDIMKRKASDDSAFSTSNQNVVNSNPIALSVNAEPIQQIKEKFTKILGKDLESFDYNHDISNFDIGVQHQLWYARNELFYQLLNIAAVSFANAEFYNQIYLEHADMKKDFVLFDVKGVQLANFGSMTPTSDIDVGIFYSGENTTGILLSYVVSHIESLFIIYTGKTSLAFDIEFYADMMTLPNREADKETHPVLFYLDHSGFLEKHYQDNLVVAWASFIRNMVLAGVSIDQDVKAYITESVGKLNARNQNDGNQNENDQKIVFDAEADANYVKEATDHVREYMTLMGNPTIANYNAARKLYYSKVDAAETEKYRLYPGNQFDPNKSADELSGLIKLIGVALIYRMESYCCPATIIHVVRMMQASKADVAKYDTFCPLEKCSTNKTLPKEPGCTVGPFGYKLGIIEHIGYLCRFQKLYCDTGVVDKCEKKYKKYIERYVAARHQLNNIANCGKGGRTRRRRSSKKKKSRRRRRTHKK